ncbi:MULTISPECIES: hypothetical protein [unclassified Streptomyces]|uniref:hypothetical protein n=1 Tax=unclassified Streptomyces TaxID=2593676 RepID=UPI001F31A1CB|nr:MULTISPECIES: hypothetical protein [unclassified Streptomyces]WKX18971.1 hypothetical protein Q3Y68_13345 [Streptomyces sp. HUAS CX7]
MSERTRARATLTTLATLVALTALTATACDSGTHEPDEAPPTPRTGPTASHPPTPEPPPPSAADGTDPEACADGDCEITVTEPMTLHFPAPGGSGRATLSVTEVGPNRIEYEVKSGNNSSRGAATGPGQGCLTYLREHGSGNSCGTLDHTRPSPRPDTVVIQATTSTDGTMLLHIVSP